MSSSRTAAPAPARPPSGLPGARPLVGVAVFGCAPDEAALVRELAPGLGVSPVITSAPVSEATTHLAAGMRCVSVGHKSRIANPDLLALRRAGVEYLSTRSIGLDHIDVEYAASLGITVANTAYSPDGVADHTIMLILLAIRDAGAVIRRADAHDYRLSGTRGRELRDLTVGVVGTGRIGAAVIARLQGFGCRILAFDSSPRASADYRSLDDLLRESDVVTLHAPLGAGTHHLLDAERLARMKPGAYLVNTARGPLVDTAALADALESGRLGGAALDVVEGEEGIFYADRRSRPPRENPALLRLQRLPQVVVTSHTAYYTDHVLRDTIEGCLRGCVDFEEASRG